MREIAPPSHRLWIDQKEDEISNLKNAFNFWLAGIGTNEKLFQEHIYDNSEASDIDFRQHRARLHSLMAEGESMFVGFFFLSAHLDPTNYCNIIEERLKELRKTFLEWHGDLDSQVDVPEEFKEGVRAIAAGKIVDLDTALSAVPDGAVAI